MPNQLKLKRGLAATIPTASLAEPLFTTDTYDLYIGNGSGNTRFQKYIASGTSSQFLKGDGSLDSTSYQPSITLTTTGSSGASTFISNTLNIPTYSLSGLGGEPAITPGTTAQYWRGDKSWQTLDTSVVPESGSIYFTEPRVRSTVLTGLNLTGGGTIAATDSVLQAFGKIQNQISAIGTGVAYQGTWNASTNTPTITSGSGTAGYYYVVSVAGSTTIDGISDWNVGDWIIFNGTVWDQVDNTDAVSSVNGFTGAVNLALDNISDVSAASPTNAQLLRFNGTSSLWENWTPTYISAAITSLNGLTAATQTFAVGTSGTDFAINSSTSTHTFNLPTASATNRGALSSSDWSTFNGKQDALNGTGFVKASGTTISYDNSTYLTTSSAASTYLALSGGTLTGALYGTTALFTSNTGNFNLGSQSDTAVYLHFGTKTASGGYGYAIKMAGTINASANFDNLFGLYVDYTENVGAYSGVTKFAIYQPDSGKNNYFGGPTTFNSAITSSLTATATAFIPTGSSIPSIGMYKSASNVLDFSAASTNLLSINYNTGLSTFNMGVKATYYRIVNVATAEFGINTENNQGFIGTTTNYGFNIMTNNTNRLSFTNAGAASFSSSVTAGQGTFSVAQATASVTNKITSGSINDTIITDFQSSGGVTYAYLSTKILDNNTVSRHRGQLSFFVRKDNASYNEALQIADTGAATFSSSVTSTATSGIFIDNTSGGTNALQQRIKNTSGDMRLGVESSTGGTIQVGTSAYSAVFGNQGNYATEFTTNGTSRMIITNGGLVGIGTSSPASLLETYLATSTVGANAPATSGTTPNNALARFNNVRGQVLDIGSQYSGVYGVWLQVSDKGNLSVNYPLLLQPNGGSVGIGTSSPSAKLNLYNATTSTQLIITGGDTTNQRLEVTDGTITNRFGIYGRTNGDAGILGTTTNHPLIFLINDTERMRITSGGDVYIGNSTISTANTAIFLQKSGIITNVYAYSSGTINLVEFYKQGAGGIGTISYNGTNTLYNATSDYRLKDDLKEYNGLEIIGKLKTYDFKWKEVGTRDYGMMAHELQEVLPNYVSGEKDAIKEDGSIIPQGVDYSKLVPVLVKAIQELKAELDTLKK